MAQDGEGTCDVDAAAGDGVGPSDVDVVLGGHGDSVLMEVGFMRRRRRGIGGMMVPETPQKGEL